MDATSPRSIRPFDDEARAAVAIEGIVSAAIFRAPDPAIDGLELGGAAGIEGPPLDGLIAAVDNPAHPIRRSVADPGPTFDVTPMNPGGPRLRSHLPIRTTDGVTLGVLAVAHDAPLPPAARRSLETIAGSIATKETR